MYYFQPEARIESWVLRKDRKYGRVSIDGDIFEAYIQPQSISIQKYPYDVLLIDVHSLHENRIVPLVASDDQLQLLASAIRHEVRRGDAMLCISESSNLRWALMHNICGASSLTRACHIQRQMFFDEILPSGRRCIGTLSRELSREPKDLLLKTLDELELRFVPGWVYSWEDEPKLQMIKSSPAPMLKRKTNAAA